MEPSKAALRDTAEWWLLALGDGEILFRGYRLPVLRHIRFWGYNLQQDEDS